jgi:hypothetical protein
MHIHNMLWFNYIDTQAPYLYNVIIIYLNKQEMHSHG